MVGGPGSGDTKHRHVHIPNNFRGGGLNWPDKGNCQNPQQSSFFLKTLTVRLARDSDCESLDTYNSYKAFVVSIPMLFEESCLIDLIVFGVPFVSSDSVCSPRPSAHLDAFAKSLRKYPRLSPERSSEIVERLINYTQAKNCKFYGSEYCTCLLSTAVLSLD